MVDSHVGSPLWNPTATDPNHEDSGAWDYSLGTGVKVAIIDKGFNTQHNEIKRRVKVDSSLENTGIGVKLSNIDDVNGFDWGSHPDHGHLMTMAGFAEKDNQIGTAGAAPNTEVLPYIPTSAGWNEFAEAVDRAARHADVLSFSYSGHDEWFAGIFSRHLSDTIDRAVSNGKVFLAAAGNSAKKYTEYIPARNPNVISVGNVRPGLKVAGFSDPIDRNVGLDLTCSKLPKPLNNNPQALMVNPDSNYGASGMVWAPGQLIKVQKRGNPPGQDLTPGDAGLKESTGTSTATAYVAGVVSLMKSRNPGLSPAEIKNILMTTANTDGFPVLASAQMKKDGISDVKMINAEAAVKEAIKPTLPSTAGDPDKEKALATKKAEVFFAYVDSDPFFSYKDENGNSVPGRKLRLNKFAQPKAPVNEREKQIPEQTVSYEAFNRLGIGQFVKVRGWSNVQVGSYRI